MHFLRCTALALVASALLFGCKNNGQPSASGSGGGDGTACAGTKEKEPAEKTGKDRHGKRSATFNAVNSFTLDVPEGATRVRAWFAMPQTSDPDQTVSEWKVECAHTTKVVEDELGNEFLYLELDKPAAGAVEIKTSFTLLRHEVSMPTDPELTRAHTAAELETLKGYLTEYKQGAVNDEVRTLAKKIIGTETNPLKVARLLYDAVLERVEYWVKDPKNLKSSGTGNAQYCYDKCTGNCTDFHSLYQAMCVVAKLPCRTVYGSFFKSPLDGQDKDQSYHCWLEIHAPKVGWVPLDVAVADIFVDGVEVNDDNREGIRMTVADDYTGPSKDLVDYYFGNIEHRRVVWHEGRDLELGEAEGPVNFLPKSYVEVDGKKVAEAKRKLTFTEKK
jgi:hypothetical protein